MYKHKTKILPASWVKQQKLVNLNHHPSTEQTFGGLNYSIKGNYSTLGQL